jgi:hypothetical protein
MRMTMLALVATLGAAMLAGPANATALIDTPAMNSVYHSAVPIAGCPAGWRWNSSHYNRWAVWYPAHCVRNSQLLPGQTDDPPAKLVGMGSVFTPYPPDYGLYSSGGG